MGSHGAIIGAVLSLPGPVASVEWLRDHLSDPTLRVADVRWSLTGPPGRERYHAGDLPLTVETPSHPQATWTPGPARDDLGPRP